MEHWVWGRNEGELKLEFSPSEAQRSPSEAQRSTFNSPMPHAPCPIFNV
ncbi:MAG: hypothetical protein RMY29_033310 [Nostoc sp. CreGUA01]|nr:hypothetical protein [Nostoc sp. CreGUA01]